MNRLTSSLILWMISFTFCLSVYVPQNFSKDYQFIDNQTDHQNVSFPKGSNTTHHHNKTSDHHHQPKKVNPKVLNHSRVHLPRRKHKNHTHSGKFNSSLPHNTTNGNSSKVDWNCSLPLNGTNISTSDWNCSLPFNGSNMTGLMGWNSSLPFNGSNMTGLMGWNSSLPFNGTNMTGLMGWNSSLPFNGSNMTGLMDWNSSLPFNGSNMTGLMDWNSSLPLNGSTTEDWNSTTTLALNATDDTPESDSDSDDPFAPDDAVNGTGSDEDGNWNATTDYNPSELKEQYAQPI